MVVNIGGGPAAMAEGGTGRVGKGIFGPKDDHMRFGGSRFTKDVKL